MKKIPFTLDAWLKDKSQKVLLLDTNMLKYRNVKFVVK